MARPKDMSGGLTITIHNPAPPTPRGEEEEPENLSFLLEVEVEYVNEDESKIYIKPLQSFSEITVEK